MGMSSDIMHDFVLQEIKRIYSGYDGWKITPGKKGTGYDTFFQRLSDSGPIKDPASKLTIGCHLGCDGNPHVWYSLAQVRTAVPKIAQLIEEGSIFSTDPKRASELLSKSTQIESDLLTLLERWEALSAKS